MHWMDIYMLGFFFDSTTVGMYHPPARTAGLMRMILIAFMGIFSPILSELYSNNDRNGMISLYHLVVRWIMTLALPLFLLIILFPKKVMFLFGTQYQESYMILSILKIHITPSGLVGILKLQPLCLKLIKPFLAIFIVLLLMILIKPLIMPFHTIISLIIASIIIGFSFILLLRIIGLDEDDKQVLSALKMMFFNNN